jgi:hypothetical protein
MWRLVPSWRHSPFIRNSKAPPRDLKYHTSSRASGKVGRKSAVAAAGSITTPTSFLVDVLSFRGSLQLENSVADAVFRIRRAATLSASAVLSQFERLRLSGTHTADIVVLPLCKALAQYGLHEEIASIIHGREAAGLKISVQILECLILAQCRTNRLHDAKRTLAWIMDLDALPTCHAMAPILCTPTPLGFIFSVC